MDSVSEDKVAEQRLGADNGLSKDRGVHLGKREPGEYTIETYTNGKIVSLLFIIIYL